MKRTLGFRYEGPQPKTITIYGTPREVPIWAKTPPEIWSLILQSIWEAVRDKGTGSSYWKKVLQNTDTLLTCCQVNKDWETGAQHVLNSIQLHSKIQQKMCVALAQQKRHLKVWGWIEKNWDTGPQDMYTALKLAVTNNNTKVVQRLVDNHIAEPYKLFEGEFEQALLQCAEIDAPECAEALLHIAFEFKAIQTALEAACVQGHIDTVKVLLQKSALFPNLFKNKALQNAAAQKKEEIVKFLLSDPRVVASGWGHFKRFEKEFVEKTLLDLKNESV